MVSFLQSLTPVLHGASTREPGNRLNNAFCSKCFFFFSLLALLTFSHVIFQKENLIYDELKAVNSVGRINFLDLDTLLFPSPFKIRSVKMKTRITYLHCKNGIRT